MKKALLLVATLILTAVSAGAVSVSAQSSPSITDDQISRLRANCPTALATLGQIHANDAPIYINRNQTYFSVSDKLMARLNSRLALARYDTTQLVKIASDYNTALASFRAAYRDYDDTMADALKIDCRREPVSFYDKVADARDKRQKVNDAVGQLKVAIDQYSQEVKNFRSRHQFGGSS